MSWSIKIEGLGKKYRRGGVPMLSHNFRESLTHVARQTVLRLNPKRLLEQKRADGGAGSEGLDFWAIRDVDLELQDGDIVGIVGLNGAGKSTLLKILSRITPPTTGRARYRGRLASLLEVGSGFHRELTGRENIYLNGSILGMRRHEITRKLDDIVDFAGIGKFLDTPVKFYSSGMYVRLAFSVAAHLEADILLVDEVLAVGDVEFQEKCLGRMEEVSKGGRTVIFVSHNMDSIRKLCATSILLENGTIARKGKTSDVIDGYISKFHTEERGHVIDIAPDRREGYTIRKIEVLDASGKPKPILRTWDPVTFRIHFHSPADLEGGSVTLMLSTLTRVVLANCSTQPDHQVKTAFRPGTNVIDCHFPKLYLSAGKYLIGAGLAIPNVEWLFHSVDAGVLTVHPNDVYRSGMAPSNNRYLVPMEHRWENLKHLG